MAGKQTRGPLRPSRIKHFSASQALEMLLEEDEEDCYSSEDSYHPPNITSHFLTMELSLSIKGEVIQVYTWIP